MKYIRTKDGIYEVVRTEYNEDIEINQYFVKNNEHFNKHEIIIQANTIEELCDFVMVKFNWEKLPTVYDIEKLKKKVKELHGDNANILDNYKYLIEESKKQHTPTLKLDYIKFAVDTDRGLIYVAKMNEKGVLELC